MIERIGNMWDVFADADLFLITTNGSVTQDGRLIMGRGIAKEAATRFPGLDKALGDAVKATTYLSEQKAYLYGLLTGKGKLGGFQVKYQWSDKANMDLIALSVAQVFLWLSYHPAGKVHLNYPGIGSGLLSVEQVQPYIGQFPDQVTVWRKA